MQLYCMNRADNGELNEKNGIDRSLSFWAGSGIKTRNKILTTCVRLFLEQGYKNTSITDVVLL